MTPRAELLELPNATQLVFFCPGCDCDHGVNVRLKNAARGPLWSWNSRVDRPTVSPSILVRHRNPKAGQDGNPPAVCHSFLTDGRLSFCTDSTHALAGQTVELPDRT